MVEPASDERGQGRYAFARALDYRAIVAASEKVAWTVDGVFRSRRFDATLPIVPLSWLPAEALAILDGCETLVLNHCRAFSYVHLLGNFEEFLPAHLTEVLEPDWHAERAHVRALLRFSDEEVKHQELFLRAEHVLEESCGHSFGRYFDADKARLTAFTRGILDHPPLARFLIVLALEWGTQRHYVESIRDRTAAHDDALYADILKAHWVEEAQHTKTDMREIARLAHAMNAAELRAVFEHVGAIAQLVDVAFAGQAAEEIATVERVTGRTFSATERAEVRDVLHRSLAGIMAGVGLSHPRFVEVALALSPEGAGLLGIA